MNPPAAHLLDNDDRRLRRAWHPIGRSHDIGSEPWETTLLGESIAVRRVGTRPESGHGSTDGADPIDILDNSLVQVMEIYGLVWAALESPVVPISHYPEWFDTAFQSGVLVRDTRVSAGVVIDNFLDVTHFSYLHRLSFGRSKPVTDDGYQVVRVGDSVRLEHDTVLQDGRRNSSGGYGDRRLATYTYHPPYTCHLQTYFPDADERAAATITCQPMTADATRVFVTVLVPKDDPELDEQITFSQRVLDEDLVIVSQMADPRLCLTLRAESHTRADRASVEMRRTLLTFLEACGTAQAAELQEARA